MYVSCDETVPRSSQVALRVEVSKKWIIMLLIFLRWLPPQLISSRVDFYTIAESLDEFLRSQDNVVTMDDHWLPTLVIAKITEHSGVSKCREPLILFIWGLKAV